MAAENEAKPPAKAEQESGGGQSRSSGGRGGSGRTFQAPTPGHEYDTFNWNNLKSKAVKHLKNIEKLASYAGTTFGPHAAVAAAAVRNREAPIFEEPDKPTTKKEEDPIGWGFSLDEVNEEEREE